MRALLLSVIVLSACSSPPPRRPERRPAGRANCTVTLRFEDEDDGEPDPTPSIVELPHTRVTLVRICDPGGTETAVVGSEVGV